MTTKATFEATARILREALPRGMTEPDTERAVRCAVRIATVEGIAHAFAAEYAQANPRFDRARFLKACGVSS